jgi:hypothetical protein
MALEGSSHARLIQSATQSFLTASAPALGQALVGSLPEQTQLVATAVDVAVMLGTMATAVRASVTNPA